MRARRERLERVETETEDAAGEDGSTRIEEGMRDRVRKDLERAGIASRVFYPHPLHTLPLYTAGRRSLPVTEALAREALCLPIWPELPLEDVARVADALGAALRSGMD